MFCFVHARALHSLLTSPHLISLPSPPARACVLSPLQGSKYVEDPYTSARFQPQCEGQLSPLGDFVKIGADASGLLVSSTQVR